MNTQNIIKDIERSYTQYSLSDSDVMLSYSTRDFIRFLKSFDVVNSIIEEVKSQHSFSESDLEKIMSDRNSPRNVMRLVGDSRESYVSFLLHYFDRIFHNGTFHTSALYDDAKWLCSNNTEYDKKERIRLFQQNTIYPIATYVIDRLREGNLLCYVLEQFKIRAMRFKCLQGVKDEREIQNRIAMYLYDNGNENHREENSGNGNPDFLISDVEGQFVVEIKYIKEDTSVGKKVFEKWTSQLIYYMSEYPSYQGVLYIVSKKNCIFEWKGAPSNMTIMNVYIGDQKPSEMVKPQVYEVEIK